MKHFTDLFNRCLPVDTQKGSTYTVLVRNLIPSKIPIQELEHDIHFLLSKSLNAAFEESKFIVTLISNALGIEIKELLVIDGAFYFEEIFKCVQLPKPKVK